MSAEADPTSQSAFVVFLEDQTRGTIVLEDHRERGAVVLLACTPLGGGGAGALVPGPLPSQPDDGYVIFSTALEEVTRGELKLTIDVAEMPAGLLEFDLNTFIAKAREVASYTDRVHLDEDSAVEWGLR